MKEQPQIEQPKINKEKVETDVPQPRFLEKEEFSKRFSPDMKYQDISEKDIQDFRDHILGGIEENKKAFIEHMSKAGTPEGKMNGNIWNVLIGQKQRAFAHKVFARAEGKYLPIEQMGRLDVRYFLKKGCNYMAEDKDWDKYFNDGEMPKEFKAELEKPKIETKPAFAEASAGKEKTKYEIELEKRPMPQEGEGYDKWLERIGGDNFKIAEDLEKYQKPKKKEDWPLFIDSTGSFVFNDKNIAKFYGEKDRNKLEAWIKEGEPNIKKFTKEGKYQIAKELFNQSPELYFKALVGALKGNHELVADQRFGKSIENWVRELKGEKVGEKAREKVKPEQAKKERLHPVFEASPEGLRITPEAMREWERTSAEGVKRFMKEMADLFPSERARPYIEKYKSLLGELDKGNYGEALRHFEKELGKKSLKWNEWGQKTEYKGRFKQEDFRNFIYYLAEKAQEKQGKEISPTTYKELSDFLKQEIKSWGLKEDDSSVLHLTKALEDKDYLALANQIDLSISVETDEKKLENLRKYRKFLYDKLPLEKTPETKEEKSEEAEEKKEEKPKKKEKVKREKPKAEEEKKEPTLDEQIAAKQKEIEEIERGYNIYYSPVVQDLLGLYYKDRLKDIKGLKKELKGIEKEKKREPKEMPEEPEQLLTAKEYLDHIIGTDKLFTEMALIRGKVKRKELKPEEYKKAKAKWQAAYSGTLAMNEMLSPRELEKIMKIREKEGKKKKGPLALLKKIWAGLRSLITKKIGKETMKEVDGDAVELEIEAIKKRLAEIPKEIKKGGVLGRSILEKEQKRLEKKLKKLRK